MARFPLVAEVRREVLDNVSLTVEADSFQEALEKAARALEEFPEAVTVEGIKYCYIDNRMYLDNTVIGIEEDRSFA